MQLELLPCNFFSFTNFKYLYSLEKKNKSKIEMWTTNMLTNPEKSYPDSIEDYFVANHVRGKLIKR